MTRRRSVWIVPERSIILVKGWRVGDVLREGGWRPTYSGSVGAWMLDEHHLTDVVAYFEYRNIVVHVSTEEPAGGDAA